jgi:hypothetical protein
MKTTPLYIAALLVSAVLGSAQQTFPGLKSVLTVAEWQRAGLDRLSPDQLGVIDAALIRHQSRTTAQVKAALVTAPPAAPAAAVAAVEQKSNQAQRFGMPGYEEDDWRTAPPLRAKVTKWEGGNRFRLDNGQIWEGFNPITYDLVGKDIEIQARPHGQYNLVVEGVNTTERIMRLR